MSPVPRAALEPVSGIARRARPGRMELAGEVGVLDATLAFEPVGVAEEEAEHRPEIGDEVVRRAAGDEPVADLLERLEGRRLQGEVVEATAAEHRRLAVGLGVPLYLEDVELGPVPDLDDREPGTLVFGELGPVPHDLGVE